MRRINPRGLLALETAVETTSEATPDAVVGLSAATAAAPDAVETDMAELVTADADSAHIDDQVDAAVDVAGALESIQLVLRRTMPNGGLTRADAAPIRLAIEHMVESTGMPRGTVKFPNDDGFATVSSRVRSTQLAIETIGETATKIWEAIVNAIKSAIAWIKQRFQMLFLSTDKLKKRAIEIAARAHAAKQDPKNTVFKNSGLVHALHMGGKVDPVASAKELDEGMGHLLKSDPMKAYDAAMKLVEGDNVGEKEGAELVEAACALFKALVELKDPAAEGISKPADVTTVLRSHELPGGKAIVGYLCIDEKLPESEAAAQGFVDKLVKSKVVLGDFSSKTKVDTDIELPTLKKSDIETVCQSVIDVCETIDKFKTVVAGIEGTMNKAIKAVEAKAKTATGEQAKIGATAVRMVSWAFRFINDPVGGFTAYGMITCKHLLDYCTVSLKEMEGKAEAAAGEKKDKPAEAKPAAEPAKA